MNIYYATLMDILIKIHFLLKNNESRDLIEEINSIEVSLLTAAWTNWGGGGAGGTKTPEFEKRF